MNPTKIPEGTPRAKIHLLGTPSTDSAITDTVSPIALRPRTINTIANYGQQECDKITISADAVNT